MLERVQFVQGDVLLTDFSRASVVTVYLLPELIGQLQTRFVDQLKPGTRIVAHDYPFPNTKPDQTVEFADPSGGRPRCRPEM